MQEPLPLIEPGVLTIGVDASAPPPLHSDPRAPNFDGFEVDLTKDIAARLGLSVKYKGALWSESIGDLHSVSADQLHGFERFHLQNTPRRHFLGTGA